MSVCLAIYGTITVLLEVYVNIYIYILVRKARKAGTILAPTLACILLLACMLYDDTSSYSFVMVADSII